MANDTVIVYWTPWASPQMEHRQVLLDTRPRSVSSYIQKMRAKNPIIPKVNIYNPKPIMHGNYQACSGWKTLGKNLFSIHSPIDVDLELSDEGNVFQSKNSDWFSERVSSFDDALSVDMDLGYLFFSEDPITATLTSPYMHQTNQFKYGFVTPAEFNISYWFRSWAIIFQLWEGVKSLQIKNDEPIAYIRFNTDKKIEFREFKLTPTLINAAIACQDYKLFKQFEPLSQLYNRFCRTSLRKRVLNEIKANLI
jgi:hypothetical protein